jgi:gliding motility-associated-like protein
MKKFILFILTIICINNLFSQSISGTINAYTKVNAINGAGSVLTVANPMPFAANDKVLIIQMKGANIITVGGATYGDITTMNGTGTYEFTSILNVVGNDITLDFTLCNTYDVNSAVQLIKVPVYTNPNITGTLTCPNWNGNEGGVLVLYATGNVDFSSNIDVSATGFQGGMVCNSGFGCSSSGTYFSAGTSSASCGGGFKGESVAIPPLGHENSRGKMANGGGGSNNGNNGGGGGGNAGAGGRSGDEYSGCGTTTVWASGGQILSALNDKILTGGGGGGGFADNGQVVTPGGNAGGTVIIVANQITGNGNSIITNGASVTTIANDEGSGGGGAGGSVYLFCNNYTTNLNVTANGGNGGSNNNQIFTSDCHGPGGGGGGGALWVPSAAALANVTLSATGGLAGLVLNPLSSCFNTSWNATAGNAGTSFTNLAPLNVPASSINLGNDTSICVADSFILDPGILSSYLWSTGATIQTIVVSQSGTYWVTAFGCGGQSLTDTINIYVNTSPTITLGNDTTICFYDTISLQPTPSNFPIMVWNTGSNSNTINTTTTGNYWVNVTDGNGCSARDTIFVFKKFVDALLIANNDSLCINQALNLTNLSIGNPTSWTWNFGDGTILNGGNTATHLYNAQGNYVYSLTITDVFGCVDSIKNTVFIENNYSVNFSVSDSVICVGEMIFCYDTLTENALSFEYNFGDQIIELNNSNPIHTYETANVYSLTLTSQFLVCPTQSVTRKIDVGNHPIINLGKDSSFCVGTSSPITLLANVGGASGVYLWNNGSTLPSIPVVEAGEYWCQVTTANNCINSDTVKIFRDCYLNIPNSFTPNGDGDNDYFFPLNLLSSGLNTFRMDIYNRWGEVVFTTSNINSKGWDGKFGGKDQALGVYIYQITAQIKNDMSRNYTGNVTLLR